MTDEIPLEVYWNRINLRLQGNKPNRWIRLSDAVPIIVEKLNEEMSLAREVLHTQALPPAVPWVSVVRAWWEDGNREAVIEIRRELLIRAQIDLVADIILLDNEYRTSEYDSYRISLKYDNFYVEQNHLEAWLEKYKARGDQAVHWLPVGADHIPVWTSAAMPWEEYGPEPECELLLPDAEGACGAWDTINYYLQGDKTNRWVRLNDAVRIIKQKLNEEMGEARKWLLKKALPPAVPWVGLRYVMSNGDRAPPWPMEINSHDKDVNFATLTVATPEGMFRDIYIELNHLEAWLEKQ
jgi:hypothetical protein